DETDGATDIMFRWPDKLAALYLSLITHAMSTFSSRDVMRFLGKVRIPKSGVDVFNVLGTMESCPTYFCAGP
ncbi:MAG TPA: hypothetical protein VK137_01645, partial [Planctomycetaceae bacterium]|nr:hypothetical protein [Planctomycetaceae bacterium]